MISFSLLSFRPFSGSGLIEIPAVPGGPGILINPSGSWTSSRPPTRTSSAARPSRPFGPVRFSGCFGFSPVFFFGVFPSCVSRKPGCVRSVWFLGLVAVFCSGFGRFVFGCFSGFRGGFPCLLCCLAFLHLFSRERASAGKPVAMAPDPPPVVN